MNPMNIINRLQKEFETFAASSLTPQEEDFALTLKDLLVQAMNSGWTYVEKVNDLVIDGFGIESPQAVYDREADDIDFREDPESELQSCSGISKEFKEKAVGYWRDVAQKPGKHKTRAGQETRPHRKFSQMQHKWRVIRQESLLYRWEKQLEAGGTYKHKLQDISQHTYAWFCKAKQNHHQVSTLDLRRIAMKRAREIGCTQFKAYRTWATDFKAVHRVVSRKITKFVSRKDVQEKGKIEDEALDFVLARQPEILEFGAHAVVNTDQSGFNLELHAGRSLDFEGVKKVEIIAQSKSALTHSYTIMPTMTASGQLVEPMYVVLRENEGQFGPIVKETMERPPNLYISCSKSRKMGKEHLSEYIQEILVPKFSGNLLFICDAWSTFTEENILSNIPGSLQLNIRKIPPGATGMIQPWDVYGFRIYKNHVKHIFDFITLNEIQTALHQRNNILRLQSLVYNQMCSPRYQDLFKYSWYKSGYILERPGKFENPVKFCFHGTEIDCSMCNGLRLITCSWCQKHLCFYHFFDCNHLCYDYVE